MQWTTYYVACPSCNTTLEANAPSVLDYTEGLACWSDVSQKEVARPRPRSQAGEMSIVTDQDMERLFRTEIKEFMAMDVELPTVGELCMYCDTQYANSKFQKQVRITAWRLGNRPRRTPEAQSFRAMPGAQKPRPVTDVERSNLIELLALLDEANSEERWLKVEGLRNLGRFSEAKDLLVTFEVSDPGGAVPRLEALIDKSDDIVCEIPHFGPLHDRALGQRIDT